MVHLAINVLKTRLWDKRRVASVPISGQLLNIASLLGCLNMFFDCITLLWIVLNLNGVHGTMLSIVYKIDVTYFGRVPSSH